MEYLAGVLGYDRIQIFLDAHPEKSGFLGSPDLLMVIGEAGGFPDLLMVILGKPVVSGLADGHLGQTSGFPDLTISISFIPASR